MTINKFICSFPRIYNRERVFNMVKVTLVTTKTCIYCPTVKRIWQELRQTNDFDYEEVDANSAAGQRIVQKFDIMSVPTTIIDNIVEFVGIPDKNRALAILNGKK